MKWKVFFRVSTALEVFLLSQSADPLPVASEPSFYGKLKTKKKLFWNLAIFSAIHNPVNLFQSQLNNNKLTKLFKKDNRVRYIFFLSCTPSFIFPLVASPNQINFPKKLLQNGWLCSYKHETVQQIQILHLSGKKIFSERMRRYFDVEGHKQHFESSACTGEKGFLSFLREAKAILAVFATFS